MNRYLPQRLPQRLTHTGNGVNQQINTFANYHTMAIMRLQIHRVIVIKMLCLYIFLMTLWQPIISN